MEATLLQAMNNLAGVLFGGAATVFVACLQGRLALGFFPALPGQLTKAEGWIFSFAVGSAVLSTIMFVLCALRLVYDASTVLVAAATVLAWLRWGRRPWSSQSPDLKAAERGWQLLFLISAAVYGVLYAVHTLAPETRTDAMGYHLGLVQRYYRHHGFLAVTTNIYAQLSQGAEMLYLFAYSLGRESAAKIVHFTCLAASVGALLAFARRHRAPRAGIFAAVLYFTCPVVIPDATSTYNDCALAFMLLALVYALALWWRHRDSAWLAVLGALIGFCFGIKYTGVVAVAAVAVAAFGILTRTGSWRAALRACALIGVTAGVIALPWLAKNAIYTGNPLAPFFNHWFPNPYFSVEWEAAYLQAMRTYDAGVSDRLNQLLAAPLELIWGERYAGSIGWIFLLAPLTLLAWRRPLLRTLLAASVVCALPWLSNAGARFLIPSVAFLALAMGLALERIPRRVRLAAVATLLTAQCVTSWPALRALFYYEELWSVEGIPWRAALRLEPEKWYLARKVEFFLLSDRIDKMADGDIRVLSFGNLPEAYFKAELLVSYQGLENQDLADALLTPVDPESRPDSALRASWPSQVLHGIRIEQARSLAAPSWTVSEIRVLRDGARVAPRTDWTTAAKPLPWHAPRLLDGNLFSSWNSREPARPGMAVEILFGEQLSVDGLELIHPRASARAHAELVFRGLRSGHDWRDLGPEKIAFQRLEIPRHEGRRAASAMLRRHGIDYVVLNLDPRDPEYPKTRVIASDPKAWGLRRVFVDRSAVLYEVVREGR